MIGAGGRFGLAAVAVTGLFAAPAWAQTERDYYPRDHSLSVIERPHPAFDPLGLPIGGFLLLPSVTTGIVYDDNIYALPKDGVSDEVATFSADLDVTSTWSRNAAALHAGVDRNQYLRAGDQSTTDYHLGADGRLDLGDGALSVTTETARFTQSRSDVDAPGAAVKPIRYNRTLATIDGDQEFGRVKLSGQVDWRRFRFDDAFTAAGQRLDQSFRNRDVISEELKADYAISPRIAVYVDGVVNQRPYSNQPIGEPIRDSHGYTIEGGADFDLTNLVRGHLQFGYLSQTGQSGLWSAHGLSGRGKIEWFATPLITVTIEGGRTIEDSAELDTPAYRSTSLDARADYELLRNLIISATAGVEWDRFQATDQRARRTQETLSARYRIGRTVVLDAAYQHLSQTASGSPGLSGFGDNRLMLTLRLQK